MSDGEEPTGDGDGNNPTAEEHPGRPCPHCDAALYKRHCKYVCPNHGVVMDCSDTFWN